MPHPDWRARLSINLDHFIAVAFRDRVPHGYKARMFRRIVGAICESPDAADITVTITIRHGMVVGCEALTQPVPTIDLPATQCKHDEVIGIRPTYDTSLMTVGNGSDQDFAAV